VSIVLETNWRENKWYQLLGFYVLLDLILPDQPNRAVRTRMLRGVGGAPCEGCPYPDSENTLYGFHDIKRVPVKFFIFFEEFHFLFCFTNNGLHDAVI